MIEKIKNKAKSIADKDIPKTFALGYILYKRRKLAGYKLANHEDKTDQQLLKENCDCQYCKNLRIYVGLKKSHHREKKILFNDNYTLSNDEIANLEEYLEELKQRFIRHKKIKDQTKKDLQL